ncbi:hypothetical protein [Nocardioides sp.]|uniref:hypothetical protein n=1 Tax=Nocardioides sp. TaxID=35761 RepID=UPI0025F76B6A|nr:hypothetical protein [Nocardioides sp.]
MTLSLFQAADVTVEPDPAGTAPARAGRRWRRPAPRWLGGLLVLLVLAAAQSLVVFDVDVPVVRPLVALVTFVGLPVLVLSRRARFAADTVAARVLYAVGLSVLGLILGGLLVDAALPAVGVDRPLAPAPLAVAWLVVDVALLAWRRSIPLVPAGALRRGVRVAVDARIEAAQALGVLALVAAVAGAVRLNNDAGGQVAVVAVLLGGGALLALLVRRGGPASTGRDVRTLWLVSTALLLATSLRGWSITGHDIQAEFLAFRLANEGQNWQMSDLPSAYNACLSVTILPTVLVQATGLTGELVFRVLLQLVFAAVPVLTYMLARRFVSRGVAVTSAVLTIAFPTFFTDMPYLVRQEVAFFFLALMLLAATEPARTRLGARVLVVVLGVGVILSHYSTTYVLLMALVAGLAALAATAAVRRRRGTRVAEPGAPLVLLHPVVVALLVAVTLGWAGPVTHTGGHATDVVKETIDALTGRGVDGPSSSDTSYWIFSGDETSPRERMDMFVDETLDYRDAEIPADERVVADPGRAELKPKLHDDGADPVANALRFGAAVLMQVFLLLGVVWLLRRRLRGTLAHSGAGFSRELTFVSAGAVAALGLIVVVPNLSVDYGVLRAFQQTLLVVAPLMAMGLAVALRPLVARAPRVAAVLAAAVPVAMFLVLAGVLSVALGGQQQRIALAASGVYYDRFFVSDAEMQAIEWLGAADHADRGNERIIANRNINVRLLALSDNRAPVADRLYPTLLSKDAFVFVDSQIMDRGVSTIFYTGDLLTYTYPLQDLDDEMDLVYSGPDARIYR